MSLDTRVNNIVERFNQFDDWEDRYKEVIKIGKSLDDFESSYRIDKFLIKGCQSQVWLRPIFKNGLIEFFGDSDAVLVKGIVGVLVEAYSKSSPDEILNYKDDFLKKIGITDHLSMNRTNGLASMLKQIKMYAVVYKTLADKGIKDAPNM